MRFGDSEKPWHSTGATPGADKKMSSTLLPPAPRNEPQPRPRSPHSRHRATSCLDQFTGSRQVGSPGRRASEQAVLVAVHAAHLVVIQSDATDPAIDGQRAGLLLDLLRGEHATDRPCSSRHSRSTGPSAVMYSRRTRVLTRAEQLDVLGQQLLQVRLHPVFHQAGVDAQVVTRIVLDAFDRDAELLTGLVFHHPHRHRPVVLLAQPARGAHPIQRL